MSGRPNFLILMVDEQRYPPVYESEEITEWRREHLITQEALKQQGLEFKRHYAGATACAPSRATLYTGQYPSLHGVTQTPGAAKGAYDPDQFWLDRSTVPTMGEYFRAAGYRTFWKGKWHASEADILIPGTRNALPSYDTSNGVPVPELVQLYLDANRLEPYGFSGWVGPEPHGSDPRNSGGSAAVGLSGRDVVYATQAADLIRQLDQEEETCPWLLMASFVNPHDIALFGAFTEISPSFDFRIDPSVPLVPRAPTADESLRTKPRAQRSYREVYPQAFQPLRDSQRYRRLYYSLHEQVDRQLFRVFDALRNSSFYQETIVLFLSDHGDLLGAHGGLFQKWYQAYEEAIHVPWIIHSPALFSKPYHIDMLTSHVDVLPTMLGLASIDDAEVRAILARDHSEVHPLVGRDLTPLVRGEGEPDRAGEPILFMTDDDVTRGLNQETVFQQPYPSVIQPNHIMTVIATLPTGDEGCEEIWKYSRYYDNPQFWSTPGQQDQVTRQTNGTRISPSVEAATCITTTQRSPVDDEIEMYNLTADPQEERNLAHPRFATPQHRLIQAVLAQMLERQCRQKRLSPSSGPVPGMPSCNSLGPVQCRPHDTTPSDCVPVAGEPGANGAE